MGDRAVVNGPTTEPDEELRRSLHELSINGSYSDLTVICQGDQYKVHRVLLCPRSPFFEACCKPIFKEGLDRTITLSEDDPKAVRLMMHYFYHLDYPDDVAAKAEDPLGAGPQTSAFTFRLEGATAPDGGLKASPSPAKGVNPPPPADESDPRSLVTLPTHARVYALAEKYQVQGLKTVALAKFKREAEARWWTPNFLRAVEEVYLTIPDHDHAMKDVVQKTFLEHPTLLESERAQEVVKSLDLCFDLMMQFRKAHVKLSDMPKRRGGW